jgi:hypothetical protein
VIRNVEKGLRSMCCKWVLAQFTKLEMLSGDPNQSVCVCEREREILTTIRKKLRRNPSTQKTKTKQKELTRPKGSS